MTSTHLRKIWRDIAARKMRTALVSLSVFVGVLGVVVLTTIGQLFTHQLEKDLIPTQMPMLRIFVDVPIGVALDNDATLRILRQQPDVTLVEGQAVYQFRWKKPNQPAFQTGQLFAYSEPFRRTQLEPLRLFSGRYPVPGRNEVAIEQRMAEKQHLKVGDTLVAQVRGFRQEDYQIVGLVFQPYTYIGSYDASANVFTTLTDAQHILGYSGFSSIYVRFKDFPSARHQSSAFRKTLTRESPYKIVFYLIDDPEQNVYIVGVRQFSRVLMILAIVAMIVANFLVTNVISTIVAEQRAQIGAMKALGATRLDVLKIYLLMSFLYGLLGTFPALLIGIPLGRSIALRAAPLANTILQDTSPPPLAVGLGLFMGLLVPVVAAIIPVWSGSRVTILEAMTDQGIVATYGKGLLPTLFNLFHLPMGVHQALNNILHRKARLALSLLSLTLAAAAFMGMFAVFYTLNSVITNIRDTLDYPVKVDPAKLDMFELMQTVLAEDGIRAIQPGVAVELQITEPDGSAVQGETDAAGEPESDRIFVTGIDTEQELDHLPLVDGTGWNGNPGRRGMVITEAMAGRLGKAVGDSVRLISPNQTADFDIIGIAKFPLETAFMEWHQLASFVGVTRDAPVPNAYWEKVRIPAGENEKGDPALGGDTVWAVGIDERIGEYLAAGFDPEQPGVIISKSLADADGYQVGDALNLQPLDQSLIESLSDGTASSYPIIGIVDVRSQELSLVTRDAPPELLEEDRPFIVALYWPQLAALVKLDYRNISLKTFYVDLANPERMENAFMKPSAVFSNQVAFADRIAQTILSLGLLMSFASMLMAVVGGIGLLTITSIGVFERQREIGVMRSVGATSRIIVRQFLMEGLLIGLLAWLAGLPLSYLLSRVLISSVPFNQVITFHYTPWAAFIGLAGMLLVTAASTFYPSTSAARKTVSEILHYQ